MRLQLKLKKFVNYEKSDTWLLKSSIANFSCHTLYVSALYQ
ncbi:hypothetical protein HOLDEFILI_03379 [Holdemania filiformis DSM 12042]|uniref:Uncharacterized protein n=1 Tax=Holdemania filiformis DSM 12042 TaxID=545696 RepID=B9YC22_9FIRM|nr:hypothetical protein HOLDEFILI_03379 [Holdemania filiformis DSM 12042]